jgi:hypothetical protein
MKNFVKIEATPVVTVVKLESMKWMCGQMGEAQNAYRIFVEHLNSIILTAENYNIKVDVTVFRLVF